MSIKVDELGRAFIVDPLGEFKDFTRVEMLANLGAIPGWCFDEEYLHLPAKDALELLYGFGTLDHINEGAKIDSDGILEFKNDPKMYPLCKMIRGTETIYQYVYGIVGITNKYGNIFVTRMN